MSIPGAGGAAPNKGGGSGDKNKDDLQQYLPGGAKDPNLAKAYSTNALIRPTYGVLNSKGLLNKSLTTKFKNGSTANA